VTDRAWLARLAAPAAFLLALTVLVLLVRAAVSADGGTATIPTAATPVVTGEAPVTTQETADEPEAPPSTETLPPAGGTYAVRAGDTLESIASQHGTTVEELVTLNPDVDPTNLQIGQTIRIP
jgi:LysM repeat protein